MRYAMVLVLALAFLSPVAPAMAKDEPAKKDAKLQEKEQLAVNINNLQNQQVRVIILQQLLNEEAGKLNAVQENFCKTYRLDVDKLRKGLYRYDDALGKFVENKVEPPKK